MQIQLSGRGVPETLRSTRAIGPARLPTRVEHTGWLRQKNGRTQGGNQQATNASSSTTSP